MNQNKFREYRDKVYSFLVNKFIDGMEYLKLMQYLEVKDRVDINWDETVFPESTKAFQRFNNLIKN